MEAKVLIFRWRGVPVVAHPIFLLLAAVWVGVQTWSGGLVGLMGSAIGLVLLFGSVLLHEFGHAVVAQHYGLRVREIMLHVFGGVTRFEASGLSPREDLWISLAGPAASFALAAVSGVLAAFTGSGVLWLLMAANLFLASFNLLPAFPLDGGRVLRAFLEQRLGRQKGAMTALQAGAVVAVGMVVVGLLGHNTSLVLVGILLLWMQQRELGQLRGAA